METFNDFAEAYGSAIGAMHAYWDGRMPRAEMVYFERLCGVTNLLAARPADGAGEAHRPPDPPHRPVRPAHKT